MKTNIIERIDETNYQQYLYNGVVVITDTLVEEIDFIGYNFDLQVFFGSDKNSKHKKQGIQ